MIRKEEIVDLVFSLDWLKADFSASKDQALVQEAAGEAYLEEIHQYQTDLEQLGERLAPFANEDYNLFAALYLTGENVDSVEDFRLSLESLDRHQVEKTLRMAVLETQSASIGYGEIAASAFSEVGKWHLSQLLFDFDTQKRQIVSVFDELLGLYRRASECIRQVYADELVELRQALQEERSSFEPLFSDYISSSAFATSGEILLLPLLLHQVLYAQVYDKMVIGMGLASRKYDRLKQKQCHYGQEVREQVLKTLADPTRYGILKFIKDGIWSNKVMAERFGISSAAISYQLKYLVEHDIIHFDPQTRKYYLHTELLDQVFADIKQELHF